MTEALGSAEEPRTPLPRAPVSTTLTLPRLLPKHPAEIVGILRFFFGVQRRCGVDVSTMDTGDPPDLFPRPTLASETTDHL